MRISNIVRYDLNIVSIFSSNGNENYLSDILKKNKKYTNIAVSRDFGRSDHMSFYPKQIPDLNFAHKPIQNGQYTIKGDQLYVAYHLLERKSTYSSMKQSGSISVSCSHGGGSYTSTSTGSITLDEVWQVGDLVLVIPSESEQQFYIVDIVRKLKECNDQAN